MTDSKDPDDSFTNNEQREEEKENNAATSDDNEKNAETQESTDCCEEEKLSDTEQRSIRPSTSVDKRKQQMLAELFRLRKQMKDTKQSIVRPTVEPYTPDIFNDLSPYYNAFMIDYTIHELQQDTRPQTTGYGRRATALGVVDPQISLKMDSFPGPLQPSRVPGTLFKSKPWNKSTPRNLPPIPMPCVPKFYQSQYQANKMDYNQLTAFRVDVKNVFQKLAQRRQELDYDKTVKAWDQMSLSELKVLPVKSRRHMNRTIMSYLGTSPGSNRALRPLTKEILADPN